MAIQWNKVIQSAIKLYTRRGGATYCLGCSGQTVGGVGNNTIRSNFLYYYDHGYKAQMGKGLKGWNSSMTGEQAWALWSKQWHNHMAFDCSGLIDYCINGEQIGHKYSSYDFGAMPKNESLAAGCAGSVLWKSGHVGLDIGYGALIEIGTWNDTIQLNLISERTFTSSHKIKGVDYTGSDAR